MPRVPGARFEVRIGSTTLVGERWEGDGVPLVLLHAGVADRRVWHDMAEHLAAPVVAYDRRGFGETAPATEAFTHLDDLLAVLDSVAGGPAWLIGNSMGGALALDAALAAPERLAGLVLIAPAVSGQPETNELDPDTSRILNELESAGQKGNLAELKRLHAWLWLDGPKGPEGRVGGRARELALEMNERILKNDVPDEAGAGDADAWSRLEEVSVPTTVIWGDRDVPVDIETFQTIAARVPGARTHVLPGAAHLPSLEQPRELASAVEAATEAGGAGSA
jgi:pimeloyl-ACP methyl ester carboxylesterase